ncbi:hypothetical protein GPC19245_43950 (plasmid) [Enterobacter asburiae]|nr:hypothetical protein EAS1808013_p11240 [Enterobacter asburiae]
MGMLYVRSFTIKMNISLSISGVDNYLKKASGNTFLSQKLITTIAGENEW